MAGLGKLPQNARLQDSQPETVHIHQTRIQAGTENSALQELECRRQTRRHPSNADLASTKAVP